MSALYSTERFACEPDFDRDQQEEEPPCCTCGDPGCGGSEDCPAIRALAGDEPEPLTLRGADVDVYLAVCSFAATCGAVKQFFDWGLTREDLDHELGDVWRAARRLLVVCGVEPINPDDTVLLASIVAGQIVSEPVEIDAVLL